jgi:hypothetical protein
MSRWHLERMPACLGAAVLLLMAGLPARLGAAEVRPRNPTVAGAVSHLLLPTSVNAPGQFGAAYKTRVSIFNPSIHDYSVRATLRDQSGEIASQSIFIRSGQTLTFNNFLANAFGIVGAGAIDLDSGDVDYRFIVNAQVYVDTGAGRYSTYVQFAGDPGAVTADQPGFAVGFSVNDNFRTNVGCASNIATPQTVTFSVFDSGYRSVGPPIVFTLVGFGWEQYVLTFPVTNGGIFVQTTGNAVCYVVEVNNVSNDGTYQLVVPF